MNECYDPCRALVCAIIAQALKDAQEQDPELATSARHWLQSSPWCAWMLDMVGIGSQERLCCWMENEYNPGLQ